MVKLKVLAGHTSPETAFVVADYPYGFKLRCQIRYWLERAPKKGYRLCSQTTNPKKAGEVWNAPKKSTYTMLAVMGLNEENHVTWTGCSSYDFDKLAEFCDTYGTDFDADQLRDSKIMLAVKAAYDKRKAATQAA